MAEGNMALPRWQCHKTVHADKIVGFNNSATGDLTWVLACGGIVEISNELANRVKGPNPVGGYYVRYEDGYESWSPAKAFEDGYTRIP